MHNSQLILYYIYVNDTCWSVREVDHARKAPQVFRGGTVDHFLILCHNDGGDNEVSL